MNPARIAKLLEPFLSAPAAVPESRNPGVGASSSLATCHSEPAQAGEEPAVLSPTQLQHISTYIDILIRWNARINLTAIRDPEEIVTRHFGESLFAATHLFPAVSSVPTASSVVKASDSIGNIRRNDEKSKSHKDVARYDVARCDDQRPAANRRFTLADIGSGAGFPGLPIKLWAPKVSLTLIESNHKKAAFLREVTRALTLTDVNIQNTRAETLSGSNFDVVTLRAVERYEKILPTAASLVGSRGRLALLIGVSQQNHALATIPQFSWSDPVPIPNSSTRILLTGHRF